MLAVVLTELRKLEIRQLPSPVLSKDTDVLLKVEKVGVCGSDVHYFETGRIGPRQVEFPFLMGHECAGTVIQAGRAVKRVRAGDQVAVDPAMPCHQCDQCCQGRQNTCRHLSFLGCPGEAPGCLSEFIVMPEECLYPLRGKLTLQQAVLCEPLSIGIYAVKQSHLPTHGEAAILGSGPIGLSVLLAARQQGARQVFMTDKIDHRVNIARQAGAAWSGNPDHADIVSTILKEAPEGLDVVYECAGQQETLDQAVELLKPGGRLMLVGIPREERIYFKIDLLRRKEITLINVRRQNDCVQAAIDLIASRAAPVDFMVTHHCAPEQAQEAFDRVADYRDGVIKAMIDFPS